MISTVSGSCCLTLSLNPVSPVSTVKTSIRSKKVCVMCVKGLGVEYLASMQVHVEPRRKYLLPQWFGLETASVNVGGDYYVRTHTFRQMERHAHTHCMIVLPAVQLLVHNVVSVNLISIDEHSISERNKQTPQMVLTNSAAADGVYFCVYVHTLVSPDLQWYSVFAAFISGPSH